MELEFGAFSSVSIEQIALPLIMRYETVHYFLCIEIAVNFSLNFLNFNLYNLIRFYPSREEVD